LTHSLLTKLYDQSGCLNGGGQIKPKPQQSPRELLQSLETIYMENVSFTNIADGFVCLFFSSNLEGIVK
jgi:hypothetical protein